jgi:hypothetical protein
VQVLATGGDQGAPSPPAVWDRGQGVAHVVSRLPSDQRQELIELVGEMAAAENNPARREFLEAFPGGFGLIDEVS